jgi:hypothetical protein
MAWRWNGHSVYERLASHLYYWRDERRRRQGSPPAKFLTNAKRRRYALVIRLAVYVFVLASIGLGWVLFTFWRRACC